MAGRETSKGLSRTYIAVVETKEQNIFAVVVVEQAKKLLESLQHTTLKSSVK